jgi:hypothetical protein
MTTDHFCFYLQNRLIQTSQTGGQRYSYTSPFSIPWLYHRTTCGLYYKSFTIVYYDSNDNTIIIYDRNDSGLYYKTLIVTNLALAMSVNYVCKIVFYVCKECSKLKHSFYDHKTFIAQATGHIEGNLTPQ